MKNSASLVWDWAAGIDIGLVNKYYDLALAGDEIAANHYTKLSIKADACLYCGHCEGRCPFGVKQESRMTQIDGFFSRLRDVRGRLDRSVSHLRNAALLSKTKEEEA